MGAGTARTVTRVPPCELAIHLGFDRARWRGLLAAGACFILPAALMVTGLAWAYVTYGSLRKCRESSTGSCRS